MNLHQEPSIEIQDIRSADQFKTASFSGYKRTEVRKKLVVCLMERKIEEACFWSAELICSGLFLDLWETIFLFVGKYIHLGNPLIVLYIKKQYLLFRNLVNQHTFGDFIEIRNNAVLRNLFAEVICTLALSDKKQGYEEIPNIEVQDISQMTTHLKASSSHYTAGIMKELDPHEITIPLNEFCFHLEETKNMHLACFWMEWIMEFDALCKKRKTPVYCEKRLEYAEYGVENKYLRDVVWLIWETLLVKSQEIKGSVAHTITAALFDIFRIKYSSNTFKKRKMLLYFAVSILTENTLLKKEVLSEKDKEMVLVVQQNIDAVIYSKIKRNEVLVLDDGGDAAGTTAAAAKQLSYSQMESKKNQEKSIQKLKLLASIAT